MGKEGELPKVLIDLLEQVPFGGGRMSAELQEQQCAGISHFPHLCSVPVALLHCILAAVLAPGRRQQDLEHFSTLFVPVVARLFNHAVHEAVQYVVYLRADELDVLAKDVLIEPEDSTVLLDVIGEASLQLATSVGSLKHLLQVLCCALPCLG